MVKWCRFARVRLPNFNALVIYNENKKTIMLQPSRKKPIVLTFLCHRIYTLNEYYTTYFVCSLEPLSFTRRALFNQHPNEWLTYEITWNYNSVSKYLQPYVMISIGSHFFVLSELLRPRNSSTVFELPNIQVKDNKAELDPRKLPVRRSQEMS